MENWIADELRATPTDEPGTARYRLLVGDFGDQTKEHISANIAGTPSVDREDSLIVLAKCLDALITMMVNKRNAVNQAIEDRRLAAHK